MHHQLLHALVKARLVEKQLIMGGIRHFSRMTASGATADWQLSVGCKPIQTFSGKLGQTLSAKSEDTRTCLHFRVLF